MDNTVFVFNSRKPQYLEVMKKRNEKERGSLTSIIYTILIVLFMTSSPLNYNGHCMNLRENSFKILQGMPNDALLTDSVENEEENKISEPISKSDAYPLVTGIYVIFSLLCLAIGSVITVLILSYLRIICI